MNPFSSIHNHDDQLHAVYEEEAVNVVSLTHQPSHHKELMYGGRHSVDSASWPSKHIDVAFWWGKAQRNELPVLLAQQQSAALPLASRLPQPKAAAEVDRQSLHHASWWRIPS